MRSHRPRDQDIEEHEIYALGGATMLSAARRGGVHTVYSSSRMRLRGPRTPAHRRRRAEGRLCELASWAGDLGPIERPGRERATWERPARAPFPR